MKVIQSKPSTKLPKVGDIFRFQTSDGRFRFGRVVRDDAVVGPFKNAWLIYIYKPSSDDPTPPGALKKEDLLLPPVLVNQSPWAKGYFHTVRNEPIKSGDAFPKHVFRNSLNKKLFDEKGNEVSSPIEPVGRHSLNFHGAVIAEIADALNAQEVS